MKRQCSKRHGFLNHSISKWLRIHYSLFYRIPKRILFEKCFSHHSHSLQMDCTHRKKIVINLSFITRALSTGMFTILCSTYVWKIKLPDVEYILLSQRYTVNMFHVLFVAQNGNFCLLMLPFFGFKITTHLYYSSKAVSWFV